MQISGIHREGNREEVRCVQWQITSPSTAELMPHTRPYDHERLRATLASTFCRCWRFLKWTVKPSRVWPGPRL